MNYVDTPPSQISSGQEMLLNAIDCAEAAEKGQLYERENDFGESTSSEYEIEEEESIDQTAPTTINISNELTSMSASKNGTKLSSTKSPTHRPLSVKLSFLACDVPNLCDAIFALHQWILKSASHREIENHLLQMTTNGREETSNSNAQGPLLVIIQRVLLHSSNPKQDQTVVVGCANLIASILFGPACNVLCANNDSTKVTHSTTVKKALVELLQRSRSCVAQLSAMNTIGSSKEQYTLQDFAHAVSTSILDLLRRAATEKQHPENSNDSNKQKPIAFLSQTRSQQVESDATDLTSKASSQEHQGINVQATNSMIEYLMSRRDRSKLVADKLGGIVEIAASTNVGNENCKNDDKSQPVGIYQSAEEKNALMIKYIGSTLQNSIRTSVAEANSLENKMKETIKQTTSEKEKLASRQSSIVTKRQEISSQMERMRRELEELARQDDQLAVEEKDVIVELEGLIQKSDQEMDAFKSKIGQKASQLTLNKELKYAIDKLGELEMAWIKSTTNTSISAISNGGSSSFDSSVGNSASISDDLNEEVDVPLFTILPTKLTNYLNRAKSYFQSEAACVEYLRNRVSSSKAEISNLEIEIEAYSNLDMKHNMETIETRLSLLKHCAEEDNIVIESLRSDAKQMREDLIRRVEEYFVVMNSDDNTGDANTPPNTEVLNATQIRALEEISIDLTTIGFYEDKNGGMGAIFTKIPKQVSSVSSPTSTNSEHECNRSTSYTADITIQSGSKTDEATTPQKLPVSTITPVKKTPKFSWADKGNPPPKKEIKSLLEIQQEELAIAASRENEEPR